MKYCNMCQTQLNENRLVLAGRRRPIAVCPACAEHLNKQLGFTLLRGGNSDESIGNTNSEDETQDGRRDIY